MKNSILRMGSLLMVISFLTFSIACKDGYCGFEEICPNCELLPEVGPCNAAFPKFYFDKEDNKCKEFIWGGCAGVVPFETLEECESCNCEG